MKAYLDGLGPTGAPTEDPTAPIVVCCSIVHDAEDDPEATVREAGSLARYWLDLVRPAGFWHPVPILLTTGGWPRRQHSEQLRKRDRDADLQPHFDQMLDADLDLDLVGISSGYDCLQISWSSRSIDGDECRFLATTFTMSFGSESPEVSPARTLQGVERVALTLRDAVSQSAERASIVGGFISVDTIAHPYGRIIDAGIGWMSDPTALVAGYYWTVVLSRRHQEVLRSNAISIPTGAVTSTSGTGAAVLSQATTPSAVTREGMLGWRRILFPLLTSGVPARSEFSPPSDPLRSHLWLYEGPALPDDLVHRVFFPGGGGNTTLAWTRRRDLDADEVVVTFECVDPMSPDHERTLDALAVAWARCARGRTEERPTTVDEFARSTRRSRRTRSFRITVDGEEDLGRADLCRQLARGLDLLVDRGDLPITTVRFASASPPGAG